MHLNLLYFHHSVKHKYNVDGADISRVLVVSAILMFVLYDRN